MLAVVTFPHNIKTQYNYINTELSPLNRFELVKQSKQNAKMKKQTKFVKCVKGSSMLSAQCIQVMVEFEFK